MANVESTASEYFSQHSDFLKDLKAGLGKLKAASLSDCLFSSEMRDVNHTQVNQQYLLVDYNAGAIKVYQDSSFITGRRNREVINVIGELNKKPLMAEFEELPLIASFSREEEFVASTSAADIYDLVKNLESKGVIAKDKYPLDFFLLPQKEYAEIVDYDMGEVAEDLFKVEKALKNCKDENFKNILWKEEDGMFLFGENEYFYLIKKTQEIGDSSGAWAGLEVYARKNDTVANLIRDVKEEKTHPVGEKILQVKDFVCEFAAEEIVHRFSSALSELVNTLDDQHIVVNKPRNMRLN